MAAKKTKSSEEENELIFETRAEVSGYVSAWTKYTCDHCSRVFMASFPRATCLPCYKIENKYPILKSDLAFAALQEEIFRTKPEEKASKIFSNAKKINEAKIVELQNKISELTEDIRVMRADTKRDRSSVRGYEEKYKQLELKLQNSKSELISAKRQMIEMDKKNKEHVSKVIETAKKFRSEDQEEIERLKMEKNEMEKELQKYRDKVVELEMVGTKSNPIESNGTPLTPDFVRKMLILCHPDKHNNSETSTEITKYLLTLPRK